MQRFDGEQAVVADVDMAANRKQALRHGEVAIAQRPLGHRLVRQMRLQFAPQRNAFDERAGLVEARLAERQGRVHVEMAIDEGRREEKPTRVERLAGFGVEPRSDRGDAASGDGDVLSLAPVGQGGVADDEVEGHLVSLAPSRLPNQEPHPEACRRTRAEGTGLAVSLHLPCAAIPYFYFGDRVMVPALTGR